MLTRTGVLAAIRRGGLQRGRRRRSNSPRIPPTGAIKKVRDNLYVIPGAGGNRPSS